MIPLLLEPIMTLEELISKQRTRIVEASFLVHRRNLLHVFGIKLNVSFQIRDDLPINDALRKDRAAVVDAPGICDLMRRLSVFLPNVDQYRIFRWRWQAECFRSRPDLQLIVRIAVAQRAISCVVDALLLVPFDEVRLLEPG